MFQIRVDGITPPAQNALLYETVMVVEGKPILRDMVFSPDHQYIYLLSDRQVHTLANTHTPSVEMMAAINKPVTFILTIIKLLSVI